MKHASESPFAARMMEKPLPETLAATANDRHFYDPPELIQIAFGGRPWFFETGCNRIHRVGLFKGLGWSLDPTIKRQDERGVTDVRVTARQTIRGKAQLFDMEFLHRDLEHEDAYETSHMVGFSTKVVHHVPGLQAHQLKAAYAEFLGEHAI